MSETHVTKNYFTQGGDELVIGGKLTLENGAVISGGLMPNQALDTTGTAASLKVSLNALLTKLKDAGLMVGDSWNTSVLTCPTPAAMPTPETQANSGHATPTVNGTEITITLDCKISDLADADHGETWGTHKWLGFGVRTGLASVEGVKFTDDTGACVVLGEADAAEATALGLSAGDFVLYIKAENEAYLTGDKSFTLWASGYAETRYTLKIVEPAA